MRPEKMTEAVAPKSYGEEIVRTTFNPSANGLVDQIKQKTAELINLVNDLAEKEEQKKWEDSNFEVVRLSERAIDSFEVACMLAVKAATT